MNAPRVYLDTNVFVAAYENQRSHGDYAWQILTAIDQGEFVGVTSELTLAEFLVKPLEDHDYERAERYQEVISPDASFKVSAIDRDVLIEAATLRAVRKSLRLPDAIHVATARLDACSVIVSDDRRLPSAPGLGIVHLGPGALQTIRDQKR
jgi:predicted nucleic acid-binding protein